MSEIPRRALPRSVAYGLAAIVVSVVGALTLVIAPAPHPFVVLCLIAAVVAASFVGVGPGLAATALTTAAGIWVLAPSGAFAVDATDDRLRLALFALVGVGVTLAHDLLRRSARRYEGVAAEYRATFELAGTGQVQIEAASGRLLRVNARFAEISGHDGRALIGTTYLDLVHPADRAAVGAALSRVVRGTASVALGEHRYGRPDGGAAWVDATATLVRDRAGRSRVLAAVQDVTSRKQAEAEREALLVEARAARAEAERRWEESERLAAVNRDLVGSLRLEKIGQTMCRAARDLTGAPAASFAVCEGDRVAYLAEDAVEPLWKGETFPAADCLAGEAIRSREVLVAEDVLQDPRVPAATRAVYERTFVRAATLLPVGRDHAVAALGVYWSRPYRPSPHERALLHALADAAAIAVGNAELYGEAETARGAAEAASRAKDEFIAVVSHELRSPLSAIRMWTALLRQAGLSSGQLDHGLAVIERNVDAQTQLVSDLLDVSRIRSGKLHVDFQATDLVSVVRQALDAVRPAAAAGGITLEEPHDRAVYPVWGDPGRLRQVAWNLLANAVKFTPEGGRVSVQLERRGSRFVRLIVADTGEGIAPESLPHVFERFRQADPSSTRRHGGLGLGLAIARHLVDLHGGRIEGTSPGVGRGATFTVVLPLDLRPDSMAALRHVHNGDRAPRDLLDGMRVLVVDDDDDARQSLAEVLRAHGADTVSAASVEEAVAIARRATPDVVVSDIGMPRVDGYALPGRLGSAVADPVPAIALTAYAAPADRDRALRAGFRAHVAKPVDPGELLALVARLGREAG